MEGWTVKSVDGEEVKSRQEIEQEVVEAATDGNENVAIQSDSDVIKVDLDNPPKPEEDAVQQVQGEAEESVLRDERVEEASSEESLPDQKEDSEEESLIELITDEDEKAEAEPQGVEPSIEMSTPAPEQEEVPQVQLPENIQKLIDFMDDTGGTLEDYVNLNKDISQLDDVAVLREYYKQTKPHLDDEEISFLMDDKFLYDQENDEPRAIKKKQLAFKEEIYNARKYLDGKKDKYYADLKLNKQNSVAPEYQEAYEFYNNHKQQQESNDQLVQAFLQKTNQVFNDEFKGFDFKVGDSRYRFKVADVNATKEYQSDLNNFIGEFVDDTGTIADAAGYHKALFAAKNADKIAQHFYEQGRADAIKQSAAKAKNIDMTPRGDAGSVTTVGGTRVKVVSGDSSSKLRIKMKT